MNLFITNKFTLSQASTAATCLTDLSHDNWLSLDLTTPDQIAGSESDQKVLGYLHMNSASCHSPKGMASYVFEVNHVSGTKTVNEENGLKNTVGLIL